VVKLGKERVHMTWDSLFWLLALTAAGTLIGEYAYQKWVVPWMTANAGTAPSTVNPPVIDQSTVVATQSPAMGRLRRDISRR
jgi:hypothetical protein